MTVKKRWFASLAIAVVAIAGFLFVSQDWLPILRYRESRAIAACRAEVQRYLKGVESLDVAAHRVARVLIQLEKIADREMSTAGADLQPGTMSISSFDSPSSCWSSKDPRVEELALNAFKLANPPGASERFITQSAQMWDSIIAARGYRSVH